MSGWQWSMVSSCGSGVGTVIRNWFVSTTVLLVGAGVTAALVFFNRTLSYEHYVVGNLIALFFVPMLTILFVFREDPAKFGLCAGGSARLWLTVGAIYAGLVVVMLVASRLGAFQRYYPLFKQYPEFGGWFGQNYPEKNPFTSEPMMMAYAEASYGLYLLCWEFFFRGYMLFGLMRSIGWPAVVVQAAAFGLLHLGKPVPEQIASYPAGIVLGMIALNARSIAPCFALHWASALTFDLIVVANRPISG